MARILTLTTDFGTRDAYVAAMKGVILTQSPTTTLVDLTHEITPQDVMEAAFVLQDAIPFYPKETIHLVVVDPTVGTPRRPVALYQHGHYFVGPDNGLFSLLFDDDPEAVVVLDNPDFWRTPEPSSTFHGRDIFAPVAAHLAQGVALQDLGTPTEELTPLYWALPIADPQGIQGYVVHIDRFGNGLTNIPRALIEQHRQHRRVKAYVGSTILEGVHTTYADVEIGEPLLLFSSRGYLEIACNTAHAASLLSIEKGTPIHLVFLDDS